MTRLDIIFDYDDVIYPWSKRAHHLCEAAGITNGNTIKSWHFWEDYGCTEQELWAVLESETVNGRLYDANPDFVALRWMGELRKVGHRIHIVTARGFSKHAELIKAMTREQISNWSIPHDSLTFSKDKTVVDAQFAIDDGVHNYEDLDAAGVTVYLMDQPHNRHHETQRRVYSVGQFARQILSGVPHVKVRAEQ